MVPAGRAQRGSFHYVRWRQERFETVDVHGLFETIAHSLTHQGMLGDFTLTGKVLRASDLIRKDRSQQGLLRSCAGAAPESSCRHVFVSTARERVTFQRQRMFHIGASSSA